MLGKTLTCWRAKCGETVFTSIDLIWFGTYCIYICYFFRFDASLKKLFVSCHYHVLFVCLAPAVFKVKHSVFLNIFRYQDYARPTLHCNIDSHIFSWLLLPEILFIFQFWWELNMLEFHFVTKKICSF